MSTLSNLSNPFPGSHPHSDYDLSTELSPARYLSSHIGPLQSRAGESTPRRCWRVGRLAPPETAPYELGGVADDLCDTHRAAPRLLAEVPSGQTTIRNLEPALLPGELEGAAKSTRVGQHPVPPPR